MKHNDGFDRAVIEWREHSRSPYSLTFRLYRDGQIVRTYAKRPCPCVVPERAAQHAADDFRRLFRNVEVIVRRPAGEPVEKTTEPIRFRSIEEQEQYVQALIEKYRRWPMIRVDDPFADFDDDQN